MAGGMNLYVANLMARFGADTSQFDKAMGKANARLRREAEDLTQLGRAMSLGLTVPIAAVGAASVKMAMDFEASMTKIITLVGIGRAEVEEWAPAVRNMAGEVGVSAGQLADALFYITSAGIRGKESLEVLEASAKAAAIGMGDTKAVAYASVSAMNAYGEANLSAEQAVATLIRTVRMGNMEAKSLPMAFGRVLPVAAELEISFQDVGASIAMMTRSGVTARLAAFALRSMLMTMVAPTHESKEAMHELGMTWAEIRKIAKEDGLLVALQEIYQAVDGNMEAFQRVIPNARAFVGALQLVGKNAAYSESVFQHLAETVEGDVQETFDTWSKTAQADMKKAWAELTEAAVTFGSAVMPATEGIKIMATAMSGLAKAWYVMPPLFKGATIAVLAFLAAVGPGVMLIGRLRRIQAALASQFGITSAAMVKAGLSSDLLTLKIKAQEMSTMRLRMAHKQLHLEMTRGTAKIGSGITSLEKGSAALGLLGAAAAVAATAFASVELGLYISDITGLTDAVANAKSPVEEFSESIRSLSMDEYYDLRQNTLKLAEALDHHMVKWIESAYYTKENASLLAKLNDELTELAHNRTVERQKLEAMTDAEKRHLSYMSDEQQHLRELIQMRDERNKKIREEYDLLTAPEIRDSVRQLSEEFNRLKGLGIPLQDIWVAMKSKIEDAIGAQYRLGESATQDWRKIAATLEENGINALDKYIDKLDNGVGESIKDIKGLLSESYDVWTRQDVLDAMDNLVSDFNQMKEAGIPMKRIWEEMGDNAEEAYGWALDYGMQLTEGVQGMNKEFAQNGVAAIEEWGQKFSNLVPEHVDVTKGKIIEGMVMVRGEIAETLAGGFGQAFTDGVGEWNQRHEELKNAVFNPLDQGFGSGFDSARTQFQEFKNWVNQQPIEVQLKIDAESIIGVFEDWQAGKFPDTGG